MITISNWQGQFLMRNILNEELEETRKFELRNVLGFRRLH